MLKTPLISETFRGVWLPVNLSQERTVSHSRNSASGVRCLVVPALNAVLSLAARNITAPPAACPVHRPAAGEAWPGVRQMRTLLFAPARPWGRCRGVGGAIAGRSAHVTGALAQGDFWKLGFRRSRATACGLVCLGEHGMGPAIPRRRRKGTPKLPEGIQLTRQGLRPARHIQAHHMAQDLPCLAGLRPCLVREFFFVAVVQPVATGGTGLWGGRGSA